MRQTVSVIVMLALLAIAGIVGYRLGLRRTAKWTEPLKVYINKEGGSLIQANQIVIQLDDGKKLTVNLQRTGGQFVSVHAGLPWPDGQDDPNWYSLVIMPSAANIIRLGVDTHPKMSTEERDAVMSKCEQFKKDVEETRRQTNNEPEATR